MRALTCVAVLLVVTASGCFGGKKSSSGGSECGPTSAQPSAGSAEISGRALGKGFNRTILIHAKDKKSGDPIDHGRVKVRAEMQCPHFMPLYEKSLPETSSGTYKGSYNLIMQGHWLFYVTLRDRNGGATTTAFPVTVGSGS
jgi:hypothetical protein